MTWPLTFYVKSLPPNVGGTTNGPVIRILEKYRGDAGIYWHEVEHVVQWLIGSIISCTLILVASKLYAFDPWLAVLGLAAHSALYKFVPTYRLWAEVEAYQEQARHYSDDRKPLFASFIAANYGLKVTEAQALEMLRK